MINTLNVCKRTSFLIVGKSIGYNSYTTGSFGLLTKRFVTSSFHSSAISTFSKAVKFIPKVFPTPCPVVPVYFVSSLGIVSNSLSPNLAILVIALYKRGIIQLLKPEIRFIASISVILLCQSIFSVSHNICHAEGMAWVADMFGKHVAAVAAEPDKYPEWAKRFEDSGLSLHELMNGATDPNSTCEEVHNTSESIETSNVNNTSTNEPIAYETDINMLPENTPFTYYSSITNIKKELREFQEYIIKQDCKSYEETRDAALVYVQEHFPTNIWASSETDMSTCAGTEIVNTINTINELRQETDMASSFLTIAISTINAGTCLNVLDNPELLGKVFDNGIEQFFT